MRYLITLLLLFVTAPSFAATYYCDNAATGNNNGTSWADAWTDIVSASSSLSAGDTLYVSGGTTSKTYNITESIIPSSGTSGNIVTVQTGQEAGHNGTVIIDGGDAVDKLFNIVARDYLMISGDVNGERHMTLQNWGGAGAGNSSYAISGYGGTLSGVIIDHLNIINDDITCADETCVPRAELKQCIYITASTDGTTIQDSYLDGCVSNSIVLSVSNPTGYDQAFVQDNEIKGYKNQYGQGGPDIVKGCNGVTIRGNKFYHVFHDNADFNPNHPTEDGIQVVGYANSDNTNYVKAYNNISYGVSQGPMRFDASLTCDGDFCDMDEIQIYNNLFYATDNLNYQRGFAWDAENGHNVNVYNNTFAGYDFLGMVIAKKDADDVAMNIYNNIFLDSPVSVTSSGGDADELVFSNNLIINSDGTSDGISGHVQVVDPYDSNLDFDFVDYTFGNPDSDFHLADTATMAIGTGVELSSSFTTDLDGNTRTVPWDLGAYVYDGSYAPPDPEPEPTVNPVFYGPYRFGGSIIRGVQ